MRRYAVLMTAADCARTRNAIAQRCSPRPARCSASRAWKRRSTRSPAGPASATPRCIAAFRTAASWSPRSSPAGRSTMSSWPSGRCRARPVGGFVGLPHRLCEMQATDRGLSELIVRSPSTATTAYRIAGHCPAPRHQVIRRAQAAGASPRTSPVVSTVLMMANAGVVHRSAEPDAWRRQLALLIQGLPGHPSNSLSNDPEKVRIARNSARAGRYAADFHLKLKG